MKTIKPRREKSRKIPGFFLKDPPQTAAKVGGELDEFPPQFNFLSFSLSFKDFYLKMKYVIDHWHPDILNLGFAWFW